MLSNYLKIAFRNLLRNPLYTFLNIAGLAVGLAAGTLVMLWVADEFSYNRFIPNLSSIHLILQNQTQGGETYTFQSTPAPLAPVTAGPAADLAPRSPGLTRRLRSLLKTGPFHRLRAGQGRFQCLLPHDDPTALGLAALDTLVNALGVAAGVASEDLAAALAPILRDNDERAGVTPDPERHREVAALVIGVLLNDPGRRQAYEDEYLDLDERERRVLRYRLASEHETPEGRIVIRAEPDGVNLLLRALDIDLEDAQAATEAALRAQLTRGRFDLALHSAHEARVRSVQYHDQLHALLRRTRRDVANVDWRAEVPRLLEAARLHLEARLASEREILSEVHACLERLIDDDRDDAARAAAALLRMRALIDDCCQRHLRLHPLLLNAYDVFLSEQARQRFAPAPALTVLSPERELLLPTLGLSSAAALEVCDAFAAGATSARAPLLLDLSRLWDTLLRPTRARGGHLGPPLPDEPLRRLREEPPLFDEDTRERVDQRLRAAAESNPPPRLSQLLPEFAGEDAAERLLTLRCLHLFAPENVDPAALPLRTERCGEPLCHPRFAGDDLLIVKAGPAGPERPDDSNGAQDARHP